MTEFEAIYRVHFSDVERYLCSLCADTDLAEELTAQVFFQAMNALPKFRGDCDIRTWLCALAKNSYCSYLRKTGKTISIEELQIQDAIPGPEDLLIDKDDILRIHKALHALQEPYKEVFSLRVLGQLPFQQIGELFGKTANWACVTFHRAKQKIINIMEAKSE